MSVFELDSARMESDLPPEAANDAVGGFSVERQVAVRGYAWQHRRRPMYCRTNRSMAVTPIGTGRVFGVLPTDPEGLRKLAGGASHRLTRKRELALEGRHSTLLIRAHSS